MIKSSLLLFKNPNDTLNALLLLFIHEDVSLDYGAVIDDYAGRNQRRMTFINPCSEEICHLC